MGTDIEGWVEIRYKNLPYDSRWLSVIRIAPLIYKNYEMFALLFGERNHWDFEPIFPIRGFPENLSRAAEEDFKEASEGIAYHPTWVMYEELKSINWKQETDGNPPGLKHLPDCTDARRGEVLSGDWIDLLRLMEILAEENDVRLVVWFTM